MTRLPSTRIVGISSTSFQYAGFAISTMDLQLAKIVGINESSVKWRSLCIPWFTTIPKSIVPSLVYPCLTEIQPCSSSRLISVKRVSFRNAWSSYASFAFFVTYFCGVLQHTSNFLINSHFECPGLLLFLFAEGDFIFVKQPSRQIKKYFFQKKNQLKVFCMKVSERNKQIEWLRSEGSFYFLLMLHMYRFRFINPRSFLQSQSFLLYSKAMFITQCNIRYRMSRGIMGQIRFKANNTVWTKIFSSLE